MVDEISIEEFESLSEDESSNSKVNWDELLEGLEGKIVGFRDVKEKVMKDFKKVLYRSEWERVCDINGSEMVGSKFEIRSKKLRVNNRLRRLYLVRARS